MYQGNISVGWIHITGEDLKTINDINYDLKQKDLELINN